jgi:hypothetical protein
MACGYLHQCDVDGATYRIEFVNPELNLFLVERATHDSNLRNSKYHESIVAARCDYRSRVGTLQRRFESAPDIARNVIK